MPFLEPWQTEDFTARKLEIEAELIPLNDAITRFINDPTQSYSIGTGQTTQQVTRTNFAEYLKLRDRLRAELGDIKLALYGTTRSAYFEPGF